MLAIGGADSSRVIHTPALSLHNQIAVDGAVDGKHEAEGRQARDEHRGHASDIMALHDVSLSRAIRNYRDPPHNDYTSCASRRRKEASTVAQARTYVEDVGRLHHDAHEQGAGDQHRAPQDARVLVGRALPQRLQNQLRRPRLNLRSDAGKAGHGEAGIRLVRAFRAATGSAKLCRRSEQQPSNSSRAALSWLPTWPYTMIHTARNRPVMARDQPKPSIELRRKKGSGTSNHMSRDPNRKNLHAPGIS